MKAAIERGDQLDTSDQLLKFTEVGTVGNKNTLA